MGSETSRHRAKEIVLMDPTATKRASSTSSPGASPGEKSALQGGTTEMDSSTHDTASETLDTYPASIERTASSSMREGLTMNGKGIGMSDDPVGLHSTTKEATIGLNRSGLPNPSHTAHPSVDSILAVSAIFKLDTGPTSQANPQFHDPDYPPVFNRLISANISEYTRSRALTPTPKPTAQRLPSSDEAAVLPQDGPFLPSKEQMHSIFARASEPPTNIANTAAYRTIHPNHNERNPALYPRKVINATAHATIQPFSTEQNNTLIMGHSRTHFPRTSSNSSGPRMSLLTHTPFSVQEIFSPTEKEIVQSELPLSYHDELNDQMTWDARPIPSNSVTKAVVASTLFCGVETSNRVCSPSNTRAFRCPKGSAGLGAPLFVHNHHASLCNAPHKFADTVRNGAWIPGMGTLVPASQSERHIANFGAGHTRQRSSGRYIYTEPCSISGEEEEEEEDLDIDTIEKLTIDSRKKFRKLRIKFDEKMRQSDELYRREQKSEEQIKRLAQENDQLLDLLLDVNDSAQIPADKRFDLTEGPLLPAIAPLVSNEDLIKAAELDTAAGQAVYKEIRAMMEEKAAAVAAAKMGPRPPKPLSQLMSTVPHLSSSSPLVSHELLESLQPPEGHSLPLTYLIPDQIDDYLFDIDASLGTASIPPVAAPPILPGEGDRDLALRNPNSVYNWLRKNEPKVFLQDNEGSEKSLGKPGALRGAGKRASIPAPSKPDALEFVEEDGIGYDGSIAGPANKGKRKRDGDDGGTYHPKAGKLDDTGAKVRVKRAYNRKKKPEDGETPSNPDKPDKPEKPEKPEKKKGGRKTKEKLSSPPPGAHPFGPM